MHQKVSLLHFIVLATRVICILIFLAIIPLYQWLTCYLLQKTYNKLENYLQQQKKDLFWSKNDIQVFYAKNLSIAFIQVQSTYGCYIAKFKRV